MSYSCSLIPISYRDDEILHVSHIVSEIWCRTDRQMADNRWQTQWLKRLSHCKLKCAILISKIARVARPVQYTVLQTAIPLFTHRHKVVHVHTLDSQYNKLHCIIQVPQLLLQLICIFNHNSLFYYWCQIITVFQKLCTLYNSQATGYASQCIWCLSQARINWEGCQEGHWHKNGGMAEMGAPISLDGVAGQSIRIVGASACVFILHQKIQKMAKCLLVPAPPGCPGQSPESCKMVVSCMCLLLMC